VHTVCTLEHWSWPISAELFALDKVFFGPFSLAPRPAGRGPGGRAHTAMQSVGVDAGFGDTRLMTAENQAKLERLNRLREVRAVAHFPHFPTRAARPLRPQAVHPQHSWVAVGPRASCRPTCCRVRCAAAPVIPALQALWRASCVCVTLHAGREASGAGAATKYGKDAGRVPEAAVQRQYPT